MAIKNNLKSVTAGRNHYARILMARLAVQPRFCCVTQFCGRERDPGIDEVPNWQIWINRATTEDQLRVEEQLENLVEVSSSILHIGAGNSSLGRRLAARVTMVLATTLHDEERIFSEGLGIRNYVVHTANKFCEDMDRIDGQFDFLVDTNPSGFACCLFHFSRMMISYVELLKRGGGLFLTGKKGLNWVCTGNNPNWALKWDDWERLGETLHMPVRRITEIVYSMECIYESGVAE